MFLMMSGSVIALGSRRLRAGAYAFLILMYTCNILSFDRPLRIDAASGARYLDAQAGSDDVILFAGPRCLRSFEYYSSLDRKRSILSDHFTEDAVAAVEQGHRVWVILVKVLGRISPDTFEKAIKEHHLKIESEVFPGFSPLYVYRIERPEAPAAPS
jgi:hypothetical protein